MFYIVFGTYFDVSVQILMDAINILDEDRSHGEMVDVFHVFSGMGWFGQRFQYVQWLMN